MEKSGISDSPPTYFDDITSILFLVGGSTTLKPDGICHSESPLIVTVVPVVKTVLNLDVVSVPKKPPHATASRTMMSVAIDML